MITSLPPQESLSDLFSTLTPSDMAELLDLNFSGLSQESEKYLEQLYNIYNEIYELGNFQLTQAVLPNKRFNDEVIRTLAMLRTVIQQSDLSGSSPSLIQEAFRKLENLTNTLWSYSAVFDNFDAAVMRDEFLDFIISYALAIKSLSKDHPNFAEIIGKVLLMGVKYQNTVSDYSLESLYQEASKIKPERGKINLLLAYACLFIIIQTRNFTINSSFDKTIITNHLLGELKKIKSPEQDILRQEDIPFLFEILFNMLCSVDAPELWDETIRASKVLVQIPENLKTCQDMFVKFLNSIKELRRGNYQESLKILAEIDTTSYNLGLFSDLKNIFGYFFKIATLWSGKEGELEFKKIFFHNINYWYSLINTQPKTITFDASPPLPTHYDVSFNTIEPIQLPLSTLKPDEGTDLFDIFFRMSAEIYKIKNSSQCNNNNNNSSDKETNATLLKMIQTLEWANAQGLCLVGSYTGFNLDLLSAVTDAVSQEYSTDTRALVKAGYDLCTKAVSHPHLAPYQEYLPKICHFLEALKEVLLKNTTGEKIIGFDDLKKLIDVLENSKKIEPEKQFRMMIPCFSLLLNLAENESEITSYLTRKTYLSTLQKIRDSVNKDISNKAAFHFFAENAVVLVNKISRYPLLSAKSDDLITPDMNYRSIAGQFLKIKQELESIQPDIKLILRSKTVGKYLEKELVDQIKQADVQILKLLKSISSTLVELDKINLKSFLSENTKKKKPQKNTKKPHTKAKPVSKKSLDKKRVEEEPELQDLCVEVDNKSDSDQDLGNKEIEKEPELYEEYVVPQEVTTWKPNPQKKLRSTNKTNKNTSPTPAPKKQVPPKSKTGKSNSALISRQKPQWYLKAWSYLLNGEFEECRACLFRAKNAKEHDDWLFMFGQLEHRTGEYSTAIEKYKAIGGWDKNPQVLLYLGHCYGKERKNTEAIEHYQKIKDWQKNKEALKGIARNYEWTEQYEKAISLYKMFSEWENDRDALFGMACCNLGLGNYEEALNIFKKIPVQRKTLLCMARCHREMNQYLEGIKILQTIPDWENDTEALLALCRCLQGLEDFDPALAWYNTILQTDSSKAVWLAFARCYQDMKQYKAAIQIFKGIPNHRNEEDVLLGLAYCYMKLNDYNQAIGYFQKIPNWETNKKALPGLAGCYAKQKEREKAIQTFTQIPNWQNDQNALLGLARIYGNNGQYQKAIEFFKQIPYWESNKEVLLDLACYYEKSGSIELAETGFNKLMKQFPFFERGHYRHCLFLLKKTSLQPENTLEILNMEKWPHAKGLYILKANYERQVNSSAALETLLYAVKRFPFYPKCYLALIKHHIGFGDFIQAKEYEQLLQQRFKDNPKIITHARRLFDEAELIENYEEDQVQPSESKNYPVSAAKCTFFTPNSKPELDAGSQWKSRAGMVVANPRYWDKQPPARPRLEALDLAAAENYVLRSIK